MLITPFNMLQFQTSKFSPEQQDLCCSVVSCNYLWFSFYVDLHETKIALTTLKSEIHQVVIFIHNDESRSFLASLLFCCDDDAITTDLRLRTTTILS